tara:strand:+ start:52 stop:2112 length:2061 start_codon:yes stop_codon:yes gene_type:complete
MTNLIDLGLKWATSSIRGSELLTAEPTGAFWDLWRAHKETVKNEGFRVAKIGDSFVVIDDRDDPEATAATLETSRASKAPEGYEIPAPDGLQYLPYQSAGVKALQERQSALLADPMGLGKTIQICSLLNKIPGELRTVLIVVPASLKLNWARELSKWLVIPRRIDVVNGGKEQIPANPDIVIINYDVLAKHSEKLTSIEWSCVVFDESHYLKNPKATRTKQAFKIRARRRYALTGTPIPNRPIEIQPILGYLDPDNFGGKSGWIRFASRYCAGHKGRWGYDASGSSNLDELRHRLRTSIMIRREKSEVLTDLPAKRRQVIVLPADKYKDTLQAERSADRVDEALTEALTMIESGGSVEFSEMSQVRHQTALDKVPAVLEHLEGITEPVVVFAHHHDVMEKLAEGLEAQGRTVVMLHGKHSSEERDQAVRDFQESRADVFIGGMKAAGVGITLTRASICLFAEIDWTPATLDQAEDRLHRIGQHSPVLCQHLVINESIDHRVIELIVSKQGVISEVLQKPSDAAVAKVLAGQQSLEALAAKLVAQGKHKVRQELPKSEKPVLDIAALYEVLEKAAADGLQWPTFRFEGIAITLATAGKNRGCLYVKSGANRDADYFGKITPQGEFHPSRDCTEAHCQRLREILADHQGELVEYGKKTGACGVCGRELTQKISIERGIGPICFERLSL